MSASKQPLTPDFLEGIGYLVTSTNVQPAAVTHQKAESTSSVKTITATYGNASVTYDPVTGRALVDCGPQMFAVGAGAAKDLAVCLDRVFDPDGHRLIARRAALGGAA